MQGEERHQHATPQRLTSALTNILISHILVTTVLAA